MFAVPKAGRRQLFETVKRGEISLRSLYCRSHGVRGRGGPMTSLAHKAFFHSRENITPSKHGTKQLGRIDERSMRSS